MKRFFESIWEDITFKGITEVYFWKHNWENFDPEDDSTPISMGYLIYRFIMMLFFIAGFLQNFCTREMIDRYTYIYLTNQTYLGQLIYFTVYFCYILYVYLKKKKGNYQKDLKELPIICKILWFSMSLLQVNPYVVFFGFWLVVVPNPESKIFELYVITACDHMQNVIKHVLNAIAALVDSFMISVPSPLGHTIFVFIFAILYGLFTLVYEKAVADYPNENDTFIYPAVNWRRDATTATIAIIIAPFATVLFHLIFSYGVYRLRNYLRKKYVIKNENTEMRKASGELEADIEKEGATGQVSESSSQARLLENLEEQTKKEV